MVRHTRTASKMNTWLTRYVKPCASGQPGANQCPHPSVCATRTWTPKPAAGIKTSLGVTMAPNQKASEKGQLEPRGGIKGTEVDGKHTQPLWDGVLLFPEDTAKRHQAEATLYTEPIRERWGPGGPLTALPSVKLLLSLSPGLGLLSF